jgi:hypothetical protein
VDFRDQNQGPNQRGSGPVDKDMRNQDSDFRNKQDSDFRDKDNRQRKGDSKVVGFTTTYAISAYHH